MLTIHVLGFHQQPSGFSHLLNRQILWYYFLRLLNFLFWEERHAELRRFPRRQGVFYLPFLESLEFRHSALHPEKRQVAITGISSVIRNRVIVSLSDRVFHR